MRAAPADPGSTVQKCDNPRLMQSSLQIAILAAGQGKRMRSALPKVLHPLAGRPMLAHVLETARKLEPRRDLRRLRPWRRACASAFATPTSPGRGRIRRAAPATRCSCALTRLRADGVTLVLYGDVPLVARETLRQVAERAQRRPPVAC